MSTKQIPARRLDCCICFCGNRINENTHFVNCPINPNYDESYNTRIQNCFENKNYNEQEYSMISNNDVNDKKILYCHFGKKCLKQNCQFMHTEEENEFFKQIKMIPCIFGEKCIYNNQGGICRYKH